MATISQPIVIGDRLDTAADSAEKETQTRLAEVHAAQHEVFSAIARTHAELLSLVAQQGALNEAIGAARQTLAVVDTRIRARAAPESELLRPRIEIARMESEMAHIQSLLRSAEHRLGLLVGLDRVQSASLADQLAMNPAELDQDALASSLVATHPRLTALRQAADAAQARVALAASSRTPDLVFQLGAGYDDEDSEGVLEIGAQAEIQLWDKREAPILTARFEVLRIRQEAVDMERMLLADLHEAFSQYDSARLQLRILHDQIIPDAQNAYQQIEASYTAGRTPYIEVLDAQRTLLEARRSAAMLAGSAAVARSAIAGLAGLDAFAHATRSLPVPTPNPMEAIP